MAGDLEAIMRLYGQLNPDDPVIEDGSDREVFERILADPGLQLSVLERDGEVVATTYLNVIPNLSRAASPYAIIENVVVDESLRGRGLGKLIMDHTLQEAWRRGCYKVMLLTGSKRASTHAFYRACGFTPDVKTGYVARRLLPHERTRAVSPPDPGAAAAATDR
ncbi:GNAT superfamily N-acetyltransferase [Microlunatus parietis]|uniref:GNAT superfamily N-acetyltransferase n=1 Tax=Microlunatus parietis TaxID=682979 RepID=A0A7Y9I820_9ACTN|nr:GNAT superfamily N-acetyltransferase [Microlunatus parietis]